jgi:hypothetical protein
MRPTQVATLQNVLDDRRRTQRNDFLQVGMYQCGSEHLMVLGHFASVADFLRSGHQRIGQADLRIADPVVRDLREARMHKRK